MITNEDVKKAIEIIVNYKRQLEDQLEELSKVPIGDVTKYVSITDATKDTYLRDIELSGTLRGVLSCRGIKPYYNGDSKVSDIEQLSYSDLMSIRKTWFHKGIRAEFELLIKSAGLILKP